MCIKKTIEVLEQAAAALKVFCYDATLNHHISKKDSKSLEQAGESIDAIDRHLVKIRISLAYDHEKAQERFIRSIKATQLHYPVHVVELKRGLKDAGFFTTYAHLEALEHDEINLERLEALILSEEAPFQL